MEFYATMPPGFGEVLLEDEIASSFEIKEKAISGILKLLLERGTIGSDEEIIARLCLDEAVVNAIKHGNGMDEAKKVHITVYGNENKWGIRIEDEGDGFDPADLPSTDDEDYFERESGRGIILITEYMDEVYYYDRGNRMMMVRNRR